MISAIVAVDQNWGIGYEGKLLEHLPPDLQYFKELTVGKPVIMGRKTWDSLSKQPLPNRPNIVVSHVEIPYVYKDACFWNMEFFKQQAWYILQKCNPEDEWFIIGGGEIYKQLLPYCDRVYVTKIEKSHKDVDTYFPNLDKSDEWKIDTCTDLRESDGIYYAFLTYERV